MRAFAVPGLVSPASGSTLCDPSHRQSAPPCAQDLIIQLEGLNPTPKPASAIDGKWTLVYSNVEVFRASPFFWAFQAGIGSEELAASIFKFTAGLPVAGTKGPFGARPAPADEACQPCHHNSVPAPHGPAPLRAISHRAGPVSHIVQLPPGADDGRLVSEVAMNLFDPFLVRAAPHDFSFSMPVHAMPYSLPTRSERCRHPVT